MNRPPSRGFPGLHQHVYSGRVPVLKTERLNRFRDLLEVFAPDDNIDVSGQASSIGLHLLVAVAAAGQPKPPGHLCISSGEGTIGNSEPGPVG